MAEAKDQPSEQPPVPALPRDFWVYVGKKITGPFRIRMLRRARDLSPETMVAPAGAKKEEDWKQAREFPELQAIFDARSAPKPEKKEAPEKHKKERPPLAPLPEEPNYLLRLLLFLALTGGAIAGVQALRGRSKAPPPAAPPGAEAEVKAPEPAQMWPEPGGPAARLEAEGKLLETYFPLLLSKKGVKEEQLKSACAAANDFVSGYEAYKSRFGSPQTQSFSERVALTMMADKRTPELDQRLESASRLGVDLSPLKFPANLRQNMAASDFGLDQALGNARFLLESVCAEP